MEMLLTEQYCCQGKNLSRAVLSGGGQAVESVPFYYFEPSWRGVYTHRCTYSFGEPKQQYNLDTLYDRQRDPWEQKNLFGSAGSRALQKQMDDLTHQWMRKFNDNFRTVADLMARLLPHRHGRTRSEVQQGRKNSRASH